MGLDGGCGQRTLCLGLRFCDLGLDFGAGDRNFCPMASGGGEDERQNPQMAGDPGMGAAHRGPFYGGTEVRGLLGVFSVQEAELSNLAPRFTSPGERVIPFLLPGAAVLLPRKKGSTPWQWGLLLLLTALGISVLTAGVLSPGVAENSEGAFFQMARGISILGVAERFEAVVAAALTLGWFCLMSLLLTAGGHMAETMKEGAGGWAVGASALIAWGLGYVGFAPNPLLLAGAMLLLWLIIPLITEKAPT